MKYTCPLTAITLSLFGLALPVAAQQRALVPRWRAEVPGRIEIHGGQSPTRLVVKLGDEAGGRVVDDQLASAFVGPDLSVVTRYLGDLPGTRVERLIEHDDEVLAALREIGQTNTGEELADLSQYFVVSLRLGTTREQAREVLAELWSLPHVEEAWAMPLPAPPPFAPCAGATPLYESMQGYRGTVGADWAEGVAGADGQGIALVDLEYSWNLAGMFGETASHEDLATVTSQTPSVAIGSTSAWVDPFNDSNHGTAVAGIVAGDANAFGVKGIARGASFRVLAVNTTRGRRLAAAILSAVLEMKAGDVLLIEQQDFGPNYDFNANPPTQWGMVASEYYSDVFSAVRQATALGIHVVAAAGNGSQDFDDYSDGPPGSGTGDPTYIVFNPAVRNSRAILVGATSTGGILMSWSNRGTRLDTRAWGELIVTTGYGDLFDPSDSDRLYTETFGGTSGASAIASGVTTALAGVHRATYDAPMQPDAMRMFLRMGGTSLSTQVPTLYQGRDPSALYPGPTGGWGFFANTVRLLGDIDGDTVNDYLITAHKADRITPFTFDVGEVHAVSGRTGVRLYRIQGTLQGEWAGWRASAIEDVNGDGITDFILAHQVQPNGLVRVYSGANGATLYTIVGQANFYTGWSVSRIGDTNGDGTSDFAIGSAISNGSQDGETRIYSSSNGAFLRSLPSPATGAWFGEVVAAAGDINQDGFQDIVVGGSREASQAGAARVYSGVDGALLHTFSGDAAGDRMGSAVSGDGDANGDGYPDVIVGAPLDDDAGVDAGRVRVFSGLDGSVLHTLDGLGAGDEFGSAVSFIGDFDRDGFDDFAAGAYLANSGDGYARLFSGKDGSVLRTFTGGPGSTEWLGASVGPAGDLNKDGAADVIVGSAFHDSGHGRAVVFLGEAKSWRGFRSVGQRTGPRNNRDGQY